MDKEIMYNVLIALPTETEVECLKKGLKAVGGATLNIRSAKDNYQLLEELREDPVELLIVSPIIFSDPLIPLVKKEVGQADLKIVAYCSTLVEDDMCNNFDGKILVTESFAEKFNVLESVLAIEEYEEDTLTPREKDVVVAVVKGLTNKEIAEEFYLSPHTIITHRRNIARKLNIHSASGLTIYAIMNKLVSLDDIKDL